ncbi:hypothetical protein ZIOFF_031151 [Zingiber officinale]|uniref:Uncharacterized protein n=1 Tax=Zingiber officinale TaxID=94328 RepID=A0A8J5GSC4_ZINOF|nr:hypothetical protein ZIOFF_031151 [Zingiber officinale]
MALLRRRRRLCLSAVFAVLLFTAALGHGRDDEAEAIGVRRALDSAATRGIVPPVVPSPMRPVLPLPPGAGGDPTGRSDRAGRVLPGSLAMRVRQQALYALNSSIRSVHIIIAVAKRDSVSGITNRVSSLESRLGFSMGVEGRQPREMDCTWLQQGIVHALL